MRIWVVAAVNLDRWVGVADEHLDVVVEPSTSPRRGSEVVVGVAGGVVAGLAGDGASVGVSWGLDPDEGVDHGVTSVGIGEGAEAGVFQVAPDTVDEGLGTAGAAGIDDKLGGAETLSVELAAERLGVVLLVVVRVSRGGVRVAEGLVVGDVGGVATDLGAAAGLLHDGLDGVGNLLDVLGLREVSILLEQEGV